MRARYLVAVAVLAVVGVCVYIFALPRDTVYENELAYIRDDGAGCGTVTARYKGGRDVKIKLQVTKIGGRTQNYNLDRTGETLFTAPLHGGAGVYAVAVYEQVEGTEYKPLLTAAIDASAMGDMAPFLNRNSMVFWEKGNTVYARARKIAGTATDASGKAASIFDYVADNVVYDSAAFDEAESGYVPDPERTLASGRGFCLDYASLMCAMLRSADIPAKLCVGDAGGAYHAWVSAYIDGEWTLFDPTFVSAQSRSAEIMAFVADVTNYTVRYEY